MIENVKMSTTLAIILVVGTSFVLLAVGSFFSTHQIISTKSGGSKALPPGSDGTEAETIEEVRKVAKAIEELRKTSPGLSKPNEAPKALSKLNKAPKARPTLSPDSFGSLCINDKVVPELYILGAQKAGTTALAEALMSGGIKTPNKNEKEFQFFKHMDWHGHHVDKKSKWLDEMVDCPRYGRKVYGDFSPINLALVPGCMLPADGQPANLPSLLSSWYGASRSRVTFVVMMRDPLSRMHSGLYQESWHQKDGESVNQWMKRTYKETKETPNDVKGIITRSLYGKQLQAWLQYFEAAQFLVTASSSVLKKHEMQICPLLKVKLRWELSCQEDLGTYHHEHGSLEDEVNAEVRQNWYTFFRKDFKLLTFLLANAANRGASLVGFHQETASQRGVADWLLSYGWSPILDEI